LLFTPGLNVRELTGDMQLTKREMEETQMIVTTPEKWDVITRKGSDVAVASLVRLLIIDEVNFRIFLEDFQSSPVYNVCSSAPPPPPPPMPPAHRRRGALGLCSSARLQQCLASVAVASFVTLLIIDEVCKLSVVEYSSPAATSHPPAAHLCHDSLQPATAPSAVFAHPPRPRVMLGAFPDDGWCGLHTGAPAERRARAGHRDPGGAYPAPGVHLDWLQLIL